MLMAEAPTPWMKKGQNPITYRPQPISSDKFGPDFGLNINIS
jgi:hypothetical protein